MVKLFLWHPSGSTEIPWPKGHGTPSRGYIKLWCGICHAWSRIYVDRCEHCQAYLPLELDERKWKRGTRK